MYKIAIMTIISEISFFGAALHISFHNIPASYFSEQTNAILMRQAVFSFMKRNKSPSSCVLLYNNLYYIKTRNFLLRTKKNTFITLKKHRIAFRPSNMSNLIKKQNIE